MDADDYVCAGAHGTIAPQVDEAYYDDRSDASDDETKGMIKFPKRLYGREGEMSTLNDLYDALENNRADSTDLDSADSAEVRREQSTTQSEQLDGSVESAYGGSRVVFLGGYSGVGKSSVVDEFVNGRSPTSARGKYTVQCEEPFSAISQLLRSLAVDISSGSDRALKDKVLRKIESSELIAPSTGGDKVLAGTFPALTPLLGVHKRGSSRSSISTNMNEIKSCVQELICIICASLSKPLVIFLDDLQWADGASIDLLTSLLTDPMLRNIMFICAYRSNEIEDDHAFFSLMENVKGKREGSESVEQINLFSLSPASIEHFIADSVKYEDINQVAELAEAVYQKTMGNIFFVKQALDELVRNNILFYDMMSFEWRWVVSKVEIADSMSDDVVSTVKGKIKSLCEDIQCMLIVMSNIPNALDVSTLRDLMCEGSSRTFTDGQVRAMQREASDEGMLLQSNKDKLYVFGHDRIRQASYECLPNEQRDDLSLKLARVLLRNTDERKEWCLFVAADLLNSVPDEMKNVDELVKLNIRVAKLAKRKGSVEKEHELLREALRCLVISEQEWKDYHLTLKLYNAVIISEHSRGFYDHEADAIDEVIINAKTLDDKAVAYLHQLLAFDATSDYATGLRDGVEILNLWGFELPESLKPSKTYFLKEEAQFKLATRRGLYNTLNDLPSTPVPVIPIFDCVIRWAAFLGSDSATKMARILAWKAIRYTAKHGIDGDFTAILSIYCCTLAKEGNIKDANEMGNVALALADRIKDRKELYAMTKFRIVATATCKLQSFRGAAETLLECHKVLKFCGKTQPSLGAALNYMFAIFAAGCELGPLIESKLALIEQYCRTVERTSFLSVFELLHQFAVNIRTTSSCELAGDIFDEGHALAKVDGNGRDMLLRDISSCRLQLAFVIGNEECMKMMLNRLKDYSFNETSNPRLHSRLCFMGLSAFALGSKEFKSIGEKCLQYFANLSKLGSVNARPVHLFLLALKSPTQQAYEFAIDACADEKFIHLEAMARERFSIYLEGRGDHALAKTHLEYSYWLFQDWSAHAKAAEMSRQYTWLKSTSRDKARSSTTSRTQSTISKDSTTESRKKSVVYVANTTLGIRRAVSVRSRRQTLH